ncbi:MAG: leucine-rich repeat domain-containing protein [Adlercreutzia sp.]|nr:leucine-rich repeat domain-containing protein [Adlercreutzia sp.]
MRIEFGLAGAALSVALVFGGPAIAWATTPESASGGSIVAGDVQSDSLETQRKEAQEEAQLIAQAEGVRAQQETAVRSSSPLNASTVTLYGLDTWAKEELTIPSSLSQTFQLKVNGKVADSYRVISGNSVSVDSNGNVTPIYKTWYWNGNIGSTVSSGSPNERVTVEGSYGASTIQVKEGNSTYTATVNFVDYASYYADGVMNDYIESNITAEQTDREKIEKIAKFVASYDYSVSASGTTSMIVKGGGDCWASTYTVIAMAEKIGFDAWARNGNRDVGAGSGHMNAMVKAAGVYYEVDAGYSGSAPRIYSVDERTSLFTYGIVSNGIEILQYDEKPGTYTSITIPSSIDGKPVVAIGSSFMSGNESIEEVFLPDTLVSIGRSAFNSASRLKTLAIPASVTTIEDFAFTACASLQNFSCSADNATYAVEDGLLLTKDRTKVLAAPSVSSCVLPSTVETIEKYAFYYNKNLTSITIPASVISIEEGAFGNCVKLASVVVQGQGLETVGQFAFNGDTALQSLYLPSSVTSIDDTAFRYCSNTFILSGPAGSYADGYAHQKGLDAESVAAKNPSPSPAPTPSTPAPTPSTPVPSPVPGGSVADSVKPGTSSSSGAPSAVATPGTSSQKPASSQPATLKKGTTFTVGSLKYKVTKAGASGKAEVQVVGSSKSKKKLAGTLKIPATVKYAKVSCKVTSIKAKAFKSYAKIKKVTLGSNLKTIGAGAFQGCTKLTTVTIGKSVTTVGSSAFKSCKNLKKVTISSSKIKKLGSSAFKGTSKKAVVKAPAKKVKAYTKLLVKAGLPKQAKVRK